MKLKKNPSITFSRFNDTSLNDTWLCTIPANNGKEIRITIPEKVKKFIELFQVGNDLPSILGNKSINNVEFNSYSKLIDELLVPMGILLSAGNNFKAPELKKEKPGHMQIQLPVIKPSVVNFFSQLTQFMFKKSFFIIAVVLCFFYQIKFYTSTAPFNNELWDLSALEQIQILSIVAFGLFFHELGHAAAAFKYGCRKVELGIGWYICFLVFYAELSEAWRLNRKERVIIDAGGMYFQSIFTTLLILIYIQESSKVIFYAVTMLNISFIWNLNPFFRMDGYWIASDALGISNLRDSAKKEMVRIISTPFEKKEIVNTHLNSKSKKLLFAYTLFSNIFFIYMLYYFSKKFASSITQELPKIFNNLEVNIFSRLNMLEIMVLLFGNLFQIMLVCFFSIFIYRAIQSLLNWIKLIYSLLKSKKT